MSTFLVYIVLRLLAIAIWQQKEIKSIQIENKEVKRSLFIDNMIVNLRNWKEFTEKSSMTNKCV